VCLDRSQEAEAAVLHAQRAARQEGARIRLVSVLEPTSHDVATGLPPDPLEWELRRTRARSYLDGLCGRPHGAAVTMSGEVVQGEPAEQVCALAVRTDADLVVLATHGEGRRTGYCLGGTAAKLVERLPISLLLVPVGPEATAAETRYRRILVPLDGSARAESALPVASALARAHDADLLLAHVVCSPDAMPAEPPEPEDVELQRRLRRRNEARAFRYLSRLQVRMTDAGLRAKMLVLRGNCARRELSTLIARGDVDLVVVTSHGRTGRLEQPFGSVADHLVRTHAVPVLVVRERSARTAWKRRAAAEAEAPPTPVGPEAR
jgi:nucleotide-binding universal stress UspA family protein